MGRTRGHCIPLPMGRRLTGAMVDPTPQEEDNSKISSRKNTEMHQHRNPHMGWGYTKFGLECNASNMMSLAVIIVFLLSGVLSGVFGDLGNYSASEDQRLSVTISPLPTDSGFPHSVSGQVRLRCVINTEPAIDIRSSGWRFNHARHLLENSRKYTLYSRPARGSVHSLTMVLTIHGITRDELGDYTCEGQNSAGLRKSATVVLELSNSWFQLVLSSSQQNLARPKSRPWPPGNETSTCCDVTAGALKSETIDEEIIGIRQIDEKNPTTQPVDDVRSTSNDVTTRTREVTTLVATVPISYSSRSIVDTTLLLLTITSTFCVLV